MRPYFFVPTDEESDYKTIRNENVSKITFSSTYEAREFKKEYDEIENFKIYGSQYHEYVYINDHFPEIKPDNSLLRFGNFDIETDSDGGYADVETADKEITSITIHVMQDDTIYLFGYKDYVPTGNLQKENVNKKVKYMQCANEEELLRNFLRLWQLLNMDIVTGWNIDGYDIPYIIRRMRRILGNNAELKLSPFGMIEEREFTDSMGRTDIQYEIVGIPALDYLPLYKKFSFKNQENFKLDTIAKIELGKSKLDYSQYKTLDNLYKKNPSLYYDYNIIDVVRVAEIEDKIKFIENQAFGFMYLTKTNLLDAFATVKPWDVIIHNYLMDSNIVIDPYEKKQLSHVLAGGFVKEPIPNRYEGVMSFDFTSLYPHLIMAFNMSPETKIRKIHKFDHLGNIDDIIEGSFDDLHETLLNENAVISSKGVLFSKEKLGFLPALMKKFFNARKDAKNMMLVYEKELETNEDPDRKKELDKLISSLDGKQHALKIVINALYGSLGNIGSRWFDEDLAESITMSGQTSVKWVQKFMNKFMNKILKTEGIDYVIAIDTDSAYLNVGPIIKKVFGDKYDRKEVTLFLEKFSKEVSEMAIKEALKELYKTCNIFDECLHMKLEIIGQAVWTGKKKYAMMVWFKEGIYSYDEPKIKMVGISAIQSSTPEVCKGYIKKSIPLIIAGDIPALKKHFDECEKEFWSLPFSKVAKPGGIGDIRKWDNGSNGFRLGTPYHFKAALTYNRMVKEKKLENVLELIGPDAKMRLSYLKMPNPSKNNAIAVPDELPEELGLNSYIDYRKQYEKTFLSAIESLTNAAKIDISDKVDLDQFY